RDLAAGGVQVGEVLLDVRAEVLLDARHPGHPQAGRGGGAAGGEVGRERSLPLSPSSQTSGGRRGVTPLAPLPPPGGGRSTPPAPPPAARQETEPAISQNPA